MVIGVISGLAASVLWLFLFLRLKPNIVISKSIRKPPKDYKIYQIKVINRRKSPALNVKAQLQLMIPLEAEDGEINNSIPIPLRRSELFQLSGRARQKKGAAVFRFTIDTDHTNLDDLKKKYPHSYLAFRLFATHPITQFGRLFKQDYPWDRIIEGKWKAVDSLVVDEMLLK